jgi:5-methylcytosine-specific restriction endonuclease McrA
MTGFVCWYCGKKMSIGLGTGNGDCCTLEHRMALMNGGTNTIDNIVLCCFECNTKKGVRENYEYQKRRASEESSG